MSSSLKRFTNLTSEFTQELGKVGGCSPPRNVACSVAGITSDANILTSHLRGMAQQYRYRYQEPMPCEQLVMRLCDYKQAYTQFGGKLSYSGPPL